MTGKPLPEISTTLPGVHHFETLMAAADAEIDWPVIDETSAYSACYTTGTTGRPKGIYYSHRGIYLHTLTMVADLGMRSHDAVMLVTPMFHGQSWGLPQAAAPGRDQLRHQVHARGHAHPGTALGPQALPGPDGLRRGLPAGRRRRKRPALRRSQPGRGANARPVDHRELRQTRRWRRPVPRRLLAQRRRRRHRQARLPQDHRPAQ